MTKRTERLMLRAWIVAALLALGTSTVLFAYDGAWWATAVVWAVVLAIAIPAAPIVRELWTD